MEERAELVERLFVEHQRDAVRVAWAITGDGALAQELAQEAFVRVYVHRRALRDPTAAPAYLRRTVVNLALTAVRRRTREREHAHVRQEVPSVEADAAPGVDVLAALGTLAPRRRACVVLRYYLDLTEAQTADALGISVGTVKSQTHKALRQLEQALGDRPRQELGTDGESTSDEPTPDEPARDETTEDERWT